MLVRGLEPRVWRRREDGTRDDSEGWKLCGMNDPVGRRGIWFRVGQHCEESDHGAWCPEPKIDRLEVCAGREGGDSYVDLRVGEVLTEEKLWALHDALDRGRWMCEDGWNTVGVQRSEWAAERAEWDGDCNFVVPTGRPDGSSDRVWMGDIIPREWESRLGRFVVTVSFEPTLVSEATETCGD